MAMLEALNYLIQRRQYPIDILQDIPVGEHQDLQSYLEAFGNLLAAHTRNKKAGEVHMETLLTMLLLYQPFSLDKPLIVKKPEDISEINPVSIPFATLSLQNNILYWTPVRS